VNSRPRLLQAPFLFSTNGFYPSENVVGSQVPLFVVISSFFFFSFPISFFFSSLALLLGAGPPLENSGTPYALVIELLE